jgi:hypothetical protein
MVIGSRHFVISQKNAIMLRSFTQYRNHDVLRMVVNIGDMREQIGLRHPPLIRRAMRQFGMTEQDISSLSPKCFPAMIEMLGLLPDAGQIGIVLAHMPVHPAMLAKQKGRGAMAAG